MTGEEFICGLAARNFSPAEKESQAVKKGKGELSKFAHNGKRAIYAAVVLYRLFLKPRTERWLFKIARVAKALLPILGRCTT